MRLLLVERMGVGRTKIKVWSHQKSERGIKPNLKRKTEKTLNVRLPLIHPGEEMQLTVALSQRSMEMYDLIDIIIIPSQPRSRRLAM